MEKRQMIAHYPPYGGAQAQVLSHYGESGGLVTASHCWNQPVVALFDGKIAAARFDRQWGMVCEYRSWNGQVTVSCRHLASVAFLVGRSVQKGEVLGAEGATGSCSPGERALHIRLWIGGRPVDPYPYFTGKRRLPLTTQKGGSTMKHQIGEIVQVAGCIYQNAWGSGGFLPGYGKPHTITKIHTGAGRRKPYQLGTAGFVGDDDIVCSDPELTVPRQEYERVCRENDSLRSTLEGVLQALHTGGAQ